MTEDSHRQMSRGAVRPRRRAGVLLLLGVFSMVFLLTAQLFTAKQMERLLAIPAKAEGM